VGIDFHETRDSGQSTARSQSQMLPSRPSIKRRLISRTRFRSHTCNGTRSANFPEAHRVENQMTKSSAMFHVGRPREKIRPILNTVASGISPHPHPPPLPSPHSLSFTEGFLLEFPIDSVPINSKAMPRPWNSAITIEWPIFK